VVILLASSIIQDRPLRRQDYLQIGLVDLPTMDTTALKEKIAATSETTRYGQRRRRLNRETAGEPTTCERSDNEA